MMHNLRHSSEVCRHPRGGYAASCSASPLHQELDYSIKVGFFFRTDAITADLASLYALQVKFIDELVNRQLFFEIGLVPQYKQGDAGKRSVAHEVVELVSGLGDERNIGNVDNEHDGADASAISLPHSSKSRLPTNVPALECYMAPLHTLHIKPDGRNRATQDLESADTSVPNSGVKHVGRSTMAMNMGCAYSRVNSPPCGQTGVSYGRCAWGGGARLTARTRSNEVLPAFCRPTIVTSISMALQSTISSCPTRVTRMGQGRRGR